MAKNIKTDGTYEYALFVELNENSYPSTGTFLDVIVRVVKHYRDGTPRRIESYNEDGMGIWRHVALQGTCFADMPHDKNCLRMAAYFEDKMVGDYDLDQAQKGLSKTRKGMQKLFDKYGVSQSNGATVLRFADIVGVSCVLFRRTDLERLEGKDSVCNSGEDFLLESGHRVLSLVDCTLKNWFEKHGVKKQEEAA